MTDGRSACTLCTTRPIWEKISAAIVRLNGYLEASRCPIDYARRRELDYSRLLPGEVWQEIRTDDAVTRPAPTRRIAAQRYLQDKIGGSLTCTEDLVCYTQTPQNWVRNVRDFPLTLTAEIAEKLDGEARRFLSISKIQEPVTWHPPLDLIDDLSFPRDAIDDMDPDELHRFVWRSASRPSAPQLAKRFGGDAFAIRFLLERHPVKAETLALLRPQH